MTDRGRWSMRSFPGPVGLILRIAAAATVVLALLITLPVRASAHALLVSSSPGDGSTLGIAPAVVVLEYSEELNLTLSQATTTDPTGRAVTAKAVAAREIRVDLLTNAPGQYVTRWIAVSRDDGHTTNGTVSFTVQSASAAGAVTGAPGLTLPGVAIAAMSWIEDAALLVALGMIFIAALGARKPELAWARRQPLIPVAVAAVAGPLVVITQALVAAQGDLSHALGFLTADPSGFARIARVLLEWHALLAVMRGARNLWPALATPIVALAASGHALGNDQLFGVALDSGHLLAGGLWAGGIVAMATLRPPGGWRAGGGALLSRFTPWALAAFSTTVMLGLAQAALNLGSPSALIETGYGRILIVKAALVASMVPLSLLAWRRRRPRMRIEGGFAIAVIAAGALLGSSAVPARTFASSTGPPAGAAGLPHGGVLTLGNHAGSVLVGLTVEPARPGPNHLTFYVLPRDGTSAAAGLDVTASVAGAPAAVRPCGDPCRSADVTLRGGETAAVTVSGAGGGIAEFIMPSLPVADGSAVLSAASHRMHQLHSYTMHETLTSGGPTVVTDYRALAPSSLAWGGSGSGGVIDIGTTSYNQDVPDGPWTKSTGSPLIRQPQFLWDTFTPYVGVHVVGQEMTGAIPTTIVAFFGGSPATPVWFRLWVDNNGLVHRAQMRAPGHFMDQTFASFDGPVTIVPPTNVVPSSPSP